MKKERKKERKKDMLGKADIKIVSIKERKRER